MLGLCDKPLSSRDVIKVIAVMEFRAPLSLNLMKIKYIENFGFIEPLVEIAILGFSRTIEGPRGKRVDIVPCVQ